MNYEIHLMIIVDKNALINNHSVVLEIIDRCSDQFKRGAIQNLGRKLQELQRKCVYAGIQALNGDFN